MKSIPAAGLLALFGAPQTHAGLHSRGGLRSDDWIINLAPVRQPVWSS